MSSMRFTESSGTFKCTSGAVDPVCEGRVVTEVADVTVREEEGELPDGVEAEAEVAGAGVGVGGVTAAVDEGSVCAATKLGANVSIKQATNASRTRRDSIFAGVDEYRQKRQD